MNLVYKKDGINTKIECDNNDMWALASAIVQCDLILHSKNEIMEDISGEKYIEYTFNSFAALKILDDKTFLLYYLDCCEDDENASLDYQLVVPQEKFWKLLEEYSKIEDSNWKQITITFDGYKFDLQVIY